MKALIDTNLLIYATVESMSEHIRAKEFFEEIFSTSQLYGITWINISEYLSFTTQSISGSGPLLPFKYALENVRMLTRSHQLKILTEGERHFEILENIFSEAGSIKGSFVHDCRIAAIMLENGIETIYTRDTDFRKISTLKVIDPLK